MPWRSRKIYLYCCLLKCCQFPVLVEMTYVVYIFVDIGKRFLVIFIGSGSSFISSISLILSNSIYFLSTRWQCNSHVTECVCVCVTDRHRDRQTNRQTKVYLASWDGTDSEEQRIKDNIARKLKHTSLRWHVWCFVRHKTLWNTLFYITLTVQHRMYWMWVQITTLDGNARMKQKHLESANTFLTQSK